MRGRDVFPPTVDDPQGFRLLESTAPLAAARARLLEGDARGELAFLRDAFFSRPTDVNWNPDADFNADGFINAEDLGRMKNFFFGMPGPSGKPSASRGSS